jgi:CDGSH-type Zn-finger protein
MTDDRSPDPVIVTPRDNGPYRVAGPVILQDVEGNRWDLPAGKPAFLCRCGQSGNKPLCDGTHHAAGFASVVRAPGTETGAS